MIVFRPDLHRFAACGNNGRRPACRFTENRPVGHSPSSTEDRNDDNARDNPKHRNSAAFFLLLEMRNLLQALRGVVVAGVIMISALSLCPMRIDVLIEG